MNFCFSKFFLNFFLFSFCLFLSFQLTSCDNKEDGALVVVEDAESSQEDESSRKPINSGIRIATGKEQPGELFVATSEWQGVKPGQVLPRGLRIQYNFQTGVLEAKLMEKEEGQKVDESSKSSNEHLIKTKEGAVSVQELKRALKDIKDDSNVQDEAHEREVRSQFRTMDELKKDFEQLDLFVKTDVEIIKELVEKLEGTETELSKEHKINLLTDLEYLVHQIDNAVVFADMGGLKLLKRFMNDTEIDVRSTAAFVLGSASQSNPKVQVKALEAGMLQDAVRLFSVEKEISLRRRLLFALSAMLRHFPFAQLKFIDLGGLSALRALMLEPISTERESLVVKSTRIIHDMLTEKEMLQQEEDVDNPQHIHKVNQYNQVDLLKRLQMEPTWCDALISSLGVRNHDSVDQTIDIMSRLITECSAVFRREKSLFLTLSLNYKNLSESSEQSDDFYSAIERRLETLISRVKIRDEL